MEISKEFTFEASHILPNHPGKCSNLHGHSWRLIVYVEGKTDKETGMVADYADLKAGVQPIIDDLDHAHLGAWETDKVNILPTGEGVKVVKWLLRPDPDEQFNPTCENLLIEIGKQLIKRGVIFSRLTLCETAATSASITREEFNHACRR